MKNKKLSETEKTKKTNVQRKPLLLLLAIVLVVPFLTSFLHTGVGDDISRFGVVTVRGEKVYSVKLSSRTRHQEVTVYPSEDEYVVIEVNGPQIRIKEDSSVNQFAVQKGWIQHPGESVVSLDQNVILRISSKTPKSHQDVLLEKKNPSFPF